MSVETRVRWMARQGMAGVVLRAAARRGNLEARMATDPALLADPFPAYSRLRAAPGLTRGPFAYTATRHETCVQLLRSEDFGAEIDMRRVPRPLRVAFSLASRNQPLNPVEPPSMLAVDGERHARYRRLVTRAFTAKAVEGLRRRTEQVADELLEGMAVRAGDGAPTADLVAEYAALLPVTIICEVLGVPVRMRETFLEWGEGAAATLDIGIGYGRFLRAERDLVAMHQWMLGHFARLRRDPGDDILSKLVLDNPPGGDGLTEDELSSIAMLLLGAGFETTVNLLGNGTDVLLRHPDQLAVLRADPSLWPNAVEEVLRYDSPVQRTGRSARRDLELGGQQIPAGAFVVALLGAANRDPAVFPDADRFDVTRANARDHLAFSSGAHYCLGASLARLEGEVGLRKLFERFPDLALGGTPRRRKSIVLRGYDTMPVLLGAPAPRRAAVAV